MAVICSSDICNVAIFFCKPITIKEAVSKISLFFDFSEEYTYDIVRNFIENKDVP